MLKNVVFAGLAVLGLAGAAQASTASLPPEDASFTCTFHEPKDDHDICSAVGVFDSREPRPGVVRPGDRDDGLQVDCNGSKFFKGRNNTVTVPDEDDTEDVVDTEFFGDSGLPLITVEDLNWDTLTGTHSATLQTSEDFLDGTCTFKKGVLPPR